MGVYRGEGRGEGEDDDDLLEVNPNVCVYVPIE